MQFWFGKRKPLVHNALRMRHNLTADKPYVVCD